MSNYYPSRPPEASEGMAAAPGAERSPKTATGDETPVAASGERAALGTSGGWIERLGTRKQLDFGAQVGVMRNLEFTAGGRAHRISAGSYTRA